MTDKPREIIVTVREGGATRPEDRTMGRHARDTQTGANLWIPGPVRKDRIEISGREAAEHVAKMLLLIQGTPDNWVTWSREGTDREIFLVGGV